MRKRKRITESSYMFPFFVAEIVARLNEYNNLRNYRRDMDNKDKIFVNKNVRKTY